MDRMIAAVYFYLRVPADISRAVGIEESVSLTDLDSPGLKCLKQAVAYTLFIIEE